VFRDVDDASGRSGRATDVLVRIFFGGGSAAMVAVQRYPVNALIRRKESAMLYYAIVFLIIALIAGFFGFFGVAGIASTIAWILFAIFIILFIVSLIFGRRRRV
jgi:uncharacterized membrane protein YtjA (UPF0391 family)